MEEFVKRQDIYSLNYLPIDDLLLQKRKATFTAESL